MDSLTLKLRWFVHRHQLLLVVKALVLAALWAGILLALWWRMQRASIEPQRMWLFLGALALGGTAALLLWLRRRWMSLHSAASLLDEQLKLEQRLVTATEFAAAAPPPPLYTRLIDDTVKRFSASAQPLPRLLDPVTLGLAVVLLLLLLGPLGGLPAMRLARGTEPTPSAPQSPDQPPQPGDQSQQEESQSQQSQDRQQSGQGQQQESSQQPKEGKEGKDGRNPDTAQGRSGQSQQQAGAPRSNESERGEQGSQASAQQGQSADGAGSSAQQQSTQGGQQGAQQGAQQQQGGQAASQQASAGASASSRGAGQSSGSQDAMRADIQKLLKEMQGELKQLEQQLAAQPNPQEMVGPPGTTTDPNLYDKAEQLEPLQGPQTPVQLKTDTGETSSSRPGGGVGKPSGEIGTASPTAKPAATDLSAQPAEELPGSRTVIPPDYQPVFEKLNQQPSE
jgi:hypothetical protein